VSTLRTLRTLVLGETWWLPAGVALLLGAGLLAEALLGDAWRDAGALALLAGVVALLVSAVRRGAGRPAAQRRRRAPTPAVGARRVPPPRSG
jgi:hypothetical protein